MNTHGTYAIRVDGHLDDHWSGWLGELDMTRNDAQQRGRRPNPAPRRTRLLRDIGAVLVEVRVTDAQAPSRRMVLGRRLHTEGRTLRPVTADNADCGSGIWRGPVT